MRYIGSHWFTQGLWVSPELSCEATITGEQIEISFNDMQRHRGRLEGRVANGGRLVAAYRYETISNPHCRCILDRHDWGEGGRIVFFGSWADPDVEADPKEGGWFLVLDPST